MLFPTPRLHSFIFVRPAQNFCETLPSDKSLQTSHSQEFFITNFTTQYILLPLRRKDHHHPVFTWYVVVSTKSVQAKIFLYRHWGAAAALTPPSQLRSHILSNWWLVEYCIRADCFWEKNVRKRIFHAPHFREEVLLFVVMWLIGNASLPIICLQI